MKLQNIFGFNLVAFVLCFALISPNLYAKWLPPQAQEQQIPEKAVGPQAADEAPHPSSNASDKAKEKVPALQDMNPPLNTDHEIDTETKESKNQISFSNPREESPQEKIERHAFDYAMEQLSQEDTSVAVIVDELTEEDINQLLTLDHEVGILVLKGEIVLFTSGDEDQLMLSNPAIQLAKQSTFIAHTHVNGESAPSSIDLENAGELVEYAIGSSGDVTAYNKDDASGDLATIESMLNAFSATISSFSKNPLTTNESRSALNAFIRLMEKDRRPQTFRSATGTKTNTGTGGIEPIYLVPFDNSDSSSTEFEESLLEKDIVRWTDYDVARVEIDGLDDDKFGDPYQIKVQVGSADGKTWSIFVFDVDGEGHVTPGQDIPSGSSSYDDKSLDLADIINNSLS